MLIVTDESSNCKLKHVRLLYIENQQWLREFSAFLFKFFLCTSCDSPDLVVE